MTQFQEIMNQLGYYFLNEFRVLPIAAILEEFESRLSTTLPSDYRHFLFEFAGSAFTGFVSTSLTTATLGEQIPVEFFHGFFQLEGQYYSPHDIRYAFQMFADSLPSGLITIASAYYGNQFCISLRSIDFGSVHFWDHDSPLLPENGAQLVPRENLSNSTFVAPSFNTFLRSLVLEPPE
jgi:hypothetical protein